MKKEPSVSFSHVQLFVDRVEELSVYKELERRLNVFAEKTTTSTLSLVEKKDLWWNLSASAVGVLANQPYVSQNRDVVRQLLAGFGFRVTGIQESSTTRSVLVTSRDPQGVQFVVTALLQTNDKESKEQDCDDFFCSAAKARRFFAAHGGRQGIGVLAFSVDDVLSIKQKYEQLHPALVSDFHQTIEQHKVLEVFACYQRNAEKEDRQADPGTVLRFVEFASNSKGSMTCCDLGMSKVEAIFDNHSQPAYCDHWVSNVFDRTEFLDTLHDTLGFTPKVDFNAGVVAAGEAQIESTVTGNNATTLLADKTVALRDQSQVYLPINNALSSVGHVHGFLKELGQGVQHIASRVEDIVDFVQKGNEYREITGEGFKFLSIPRSYYGVLTTQQLVQGSQQDGSDSVGQDCAEAIIECLQGANLLSKDGALDLCATQQDVESALDRGIASKSLQDEFQAKKSQVITHILQSRYRNLYGLLRDNVSEDTYLGIVRNQILVDIQGEDLLYQIFTSNILQRKAGEEAPFFEFIQRVCSSCGAIKPGCGGFGIRNFLTLFLSIEVSKAMQEAADAKASGDIKRHQYAQRMVDNFTQQLNESNPILTEISDAMTEEGRCQEKLRICMDQKCFSEADHWRAVMERSSEQKRAGNAKLMECSARYNEMMKMLRKEYFQI